MAVQQQATGANSSTSRLGAWCSELFDCSFDMENCFCGLCLQCKTVSDFGWSFCMPLLDCFLTVSCCLHTKMMMRYDIDGSALGACLTVLCCYPCAWCQMSRELKIRG